ncbi:hypothetical protein MMC22_004403 [Lobaria immixta]|nr:hypothetical protein [Lobaria immixta]
MATAKRAQSFEDPSSLIGTYSETRISTNWTLDITSAILSDTSILETDPSCPTGNCIFPVFSSLGFCSNCIDITLFLQQNSNCTQEQLDNNLASMNCTYWLPPSSSGLNYSDGITTDDSAIVNGYTPYDLNDAPSFLTRFLSLGPETPYPLPFETYQTPFELPDGKIIPISLTQIALIKTSPRTGSKSTGFVHTAHKCALSLCAREYNVSMTSGVLRSDFVSTSYSNVTLQANDPASPMGPNSSYTFTFPNSTKNFTFIHNPNGDFGVDFEDGMRSVLRRILQGNISFVDPIDEFRSATSVLQSGLNASINIPKTMDRVAAAMTNRLRDLSSLNVYGQSGSMELYVRVSWPWLALPVLSVILEMILLISVMKVTRKHKFNIWKISELALLFHGLDFSLHDTAEMDKASEMEEIAMALQVRLRRGPRGVLQLQRRLGTRPSPFAKTLYPAIRN